MEKNYNRLIGIFTFLSSFSIFYTIVILLTSFSSFAQEIWPGGTPGVGGSYNLTEPNITNQPLNYGKIGMGNEVYARPGSTYKGPFQTHNWWNSAYWNLPTAQLGQGSAADMLYSKDMFPLPLMVKEGSQGLSFGYRTLEQQSEQPSDWPGKNVSLENCQYDLFMYSYANPTDNGGVTSTANVVDDYGDWHVKIGQSLGATKVSTTMAKGNPFVFFEFNGPGTPVFNSNSGQMKIMAIYNNSILVSLYPNGNNGNPKLSTVNPEGLYAFYFPSGTKISSNDNNFKDISQYAVGNVISPLKVRLPAGKTQFTMSVMPNDKDATLRMFEPHAYCVITDTRFTYSYDPVKAKVTNVFTVTTQSYDGRNNAPGTINVLFRHQYIFPPASALINQDPLNTYYGPRGAMRILEGNSFSTEMYYNGSLPQLGKAQLNLNMAFINTELNDISTHRYIVNTTSDPMPFWDDYNIFKLAAQACRTAELAHQVGNVQARDRLIAAAKVIIENYLRSPDGDPTCSVYSSKLNFMTTFKNSFQAYAGMYDYHFVVAHLIYACAQVGQFEARRTGTKTWVNQWKPMVDLLIRSIDDWNRDMTTPADPKQPWFPYLRFFDPYAGHSWWSNSCVGQEAINESIQFAQAAFLWGDLTDNKPLRDMGAMIYTTESEAGKQYWFDYDNATLGAPFAPDYPYGHTGYLRESGYLYQTAASGTSISPVYNPKINSPEQIHGVTLMPFGAGSSLWMGFPLQGAKNQYQDFLKYQSGGFIGDNEYENAYHVNSFLAFSNPKLARQNYENVFFPMNPKEGAEHHMMKLLPYHFITTLDSVGRVDTIRADIPFFSTFRKDTCNTWIRHYMMYNSPGTGPDHEARTVHFTDGTCWFLPKDTLITYKLMGPDSLRKITAGPDACVNDPVTLSLDASICTFRDPSVIYEYSTDNKVTWKTLFNVKSVKDSLTITYKPAQAGTYYFRAIVLGDNPPGLMCPLRDTTDNIAMVTITDCNCGLTINKVTPSHVSCYNGANGQLVIDASGGVAPLKYSIDNGVTLSVSNTFSGLAAGTYHVYVKDAGTCEQKLDIVITEPSELIVSSKDTVHNNCYGDKTGSASIVVSGGSAPYTYLWDDENQQTSDKATNLAGGAYSVKVTDTHGCTLIQKYEVKDPSQLNVVLNITNIDCPGNSTGGLKANVTGGTAPYHYKWSASAVDADFINGLPAQTYSLDVTDSKSCSVSVSTALTDPAPMTASFTSVPADCGASNGRISVAVSGGSPLYSYLWDDAAHQTSSTATNLKAGIYTVTVKDGAGCLQDFKQELLSLPVSVVTTSLGNDKDICKGDSAILVFNLSGGTLPYTLVYTDGTVNDTISGIASSSFTRYVRPSVATTYSLVSVTDASGCYQAASGKATVSPVPVYTLKTAFTAVSCYNLCNGGAEVTPEGGVGPFTYLWSDGATSADVKNLCAGSYSVHVSDAKGCKDSASFTIIQPSELSFSTSSQNAACGAADGSATVSGVSGGTSPYTYQWDNQAGNQAAAVAVNLPAGSYQVTVMDAAGCSKNDIVEVKNTGGVRFNSSSTITNPTCKGLCDGTAVGYAEAGERPYTYSWSTLSSLDSAVTGLCAGTYVLTVTDKNKCTDKFTFNLTEPDALTAQISPSATEPVCVKGSMKITGTISGGTQPYTAQWLPDPSISDNSVMDPVVTPVTQTTYTLIVEDSRKCSTSVAITLQPTPVADFSVDTISDCKNVTATLKNSSNAIAPYTLEWAIDGNSSGKEINSLVLTPGKHDIKLVVQDKNGCKDEISKSFVTLKPEMPVASFSYSVPQETLLDPTITFVNASTKATVYKWSFGTGDSSFAEHVSFTYPDSGTYKVCLRALNDKNCYSDTCAKIKIKGITSFYIPNAFTPGGDGRNDHFMPVSMGIDPKQYEFEVFNRWGELIFSTTDISKGWDGTYMDKLVQDGVYVWKIHAKETDTRKRISQSGTVTLLKGQ